MFNRSIALSLVAASLIVGCVAMETKKNAPPVEPFRNDQIYFISPRHHETVTSPVTIRFGLRDMGVAPAGVDRPNTGHHHLLVDVDQRPPMHLPIPKTEHHLHFGDGQSEASVELSPGPHTFDPSHEPLW